MASASRERRVTEKGLLGEGMQPVPGCSKGQGKGAVGGGGIEVYFSSDDVKKWPLPPPGRLKIGATVSPTEDCVLMQGCLLVELERARMNRSIPRPLVAV